MNNTLSPFKILLSAAAFMWLIQIINLLLNYPLSHLGIVPRELGHFAGIIFAPFLHGSLSHIIANTIPFVILGFLVQQSKNLVFVSLVVWLGGGLLVWLFGRSSLHIGASGVVMGYFGFLLSHAFFTRSLRSMLISTAAIILYGSMIISLFDFRSHISFEGHIFGFIAGVASAWMIGRK
jgi:membrane associated rhomboid family serine protease